MVGEGYNDRGGSQWWGRGHNEGRGHSGGGRVTMRGGVTVRGGVTMRGGVRKTRIFVVQQL